MIRRLSVFLLTIVAMVSAVNIVCQAQELSLLTRHVREVTRQWAGAVRRAAPRNTVHAPRHCSAAAQSGRVGNFLQELYDPSSPSYRHFLTVQEFTARFGPSQEDYDAVIRFRENERLYGGWRLPRWHGRAARGLGGGHRESLPCDHGCLPAPHGKPHILCSGPGAHGGPAVPAVAHLGFGQLFDPASRYSCIEI